MVKAQKGPLKSMKQGCVALIVQLVGGGHKVAVRGDTATGEEGQLTISPLVNYHFGVHQELRRLHAGS